MDKPDGPVIAEVKISGGVEWNVVAARVSKLKPGIHNLIVSLKKSGNIELDWVRFE